MNGIVFTITNYNSAYLENEIVDIIYYDIEEEVNKKVIGKIIDIAEDKVVIDGSLQYYGNKFIVNPKNIISINKI